MIDAPPPADLRLRAATDADARAIWTVHTRAIRISAASHYTEDELEYLWDNSDSVAVVFHGTSTPSP